jgi:hypothetical protein
MPCRVGHTDSAGQQRRPTSGTPQAPEPTTTSAKPPATATPPPHATCSTDSSAVCTTACKPDSTTTNTSHSPPPTPTQPRRQLDKLTAWDVFIASAGDRWLSRRSTRRSDALATDTLAIDRRRTVSRCVDQRRQDILGAHGSGLRPPVCQVVDGVASRNYTLRPTGAMGSSGSRSSSGTGTAFHNLNPSLVISPCTNLSTMWHSDSASTSEQATDGESSGDPCGPPAANNHLSCSRCIRAVISIVLYGFQVERTK